LYNIPGYKVIHSCRDDSYGGTSIYINEYLKFEEVLELCENNLNAICIKLIELKFDGRLFM